MATCVVRARPSFSATTAWVKPRNSRAFAIRCPTASLDSMFQGLTYIAQRYALAGNFVKARFRQLPSVQRRTRWRGSCIELTTCGLGLRGGSHEGGLFRGGMAAVPTVVERATRPQRRADLG